MKYNDLINDLLDLLDKNSDIIKIKYLKGILLNDSDFLSELDNYKIVKTVENKKKLYQNKDYLEYLKSKTNINILIQKIQNKFKFVKRGCK